MEPEALQFHVHTSSEHTIDGSFFDLPAPRCAQGDRRETATPSSVS
jgi:hypothetical protein